jgi:hypothetical protein
MFLNLEKSRAEAKNIRILRSEDGKEIYNNKTNILKEQQRFYKNLYTSKKIQSTHHNRNTEQEIWNVDGETIEEENIEYLTRPISEEEIWDIIKQSPLNKSPGSDGLTTEFYKEYWHQVKNHLVRSLNYSMEKGELNISQKRGIITLIPKPQKDLEYLKNWRPITLLNQDYKYLTKLMANRLEKTMKNIISNDQSGFVKGRYIGCNIQRLQNMIESCKEKKEKGWIINIDFEKAFDTIEWSFIYKTLEVLGYPDKFIKWVKTLYNKIETCVINNGHTTEFFQPERGVRQGCPISPYLFILTTEIMNRWLKTKLLGYGINDNLRENYLISQFADDTSFALRENKEGIHKLFQCLQQFGEISGLKLNIAKTEIILLNNTESEGLPNRYKKFVKDEIHYLGCDISTNLRSTTKINIEKGVSKILKLTMKWKNRRTTLSGKIAIIKSLLIPQLTYVLTTMASPTEEEIKEINKELFSFLNSGGSEKIKRNTLIGEYEEGGYKMTDLESYIKAIKINWINRLLEIDGIWKKYLKDKISIDLKYFAKCNVKYEDLHFKLHKDNMWNEVLKEWCRENHSQPTTLQEILNQNLWLNSFIKIGKKCPIWKKWYNNDIKWIADLIIIDNENHRRFLTHEEINEMTENNINIMEYNSLISAIPIEWKRQIRDNDIMLNEDEEATYLINKLCETKKPMRKIYKKLKDRKMELPMKALNKWKLYIDGMIEDKEILKSHAKNHYSSINAVLRSFNCNFLNRNIPYNRRLTKMKKHDDSRCKECEKEETLEHLYWECPKRKKMWTKIKELYEYYNGSHLEIDKEKCLLGIFREETIKNNNVEKQRLLFLLVKHYIHINKCNEDKTPSELGLRRYIKKYLKIELTASERRGTQNIFREKWDGWIEWIEEE